MTLLQHKGLHKQLFVCIDCETTGLDPKQDRIIEVAAMLFNHEEIFAEFQTLIDPGCLIPKSSIAIHHISQEMVQGKPLIETILPELLSFIGKHIIVGHGIQFDIEVIATAAERATIPHQLRFNRYIDTLRLARLYGESPTNSLEQLRQHFNVQFEGAHRAMNDVIVNCEVFKHLCKNYKTLDHIFDVLSRPVLLKNIPLGKHKGRPFKEVPLPYLQWAASKDFDQDLLFSIRYEINRRKKGNQFAQAGNPFGEL